MGFAIRREINDDALRNGGFRCLKEAGAGGPTRPPRCRAQSGVGS